ncbi:MAG: GNAT family N-acetyltransferase [Tuberibacillus sp.]
MSVPFPTMWSKNLYFRPFRTMDAADVLALYSDSETMMLDGGETLQNYHQALEFIHAYSQFYPGIPAIRWAVELRKGGQFIGSCGLHGIDHFHKRAEIGGELLKPYRHIGFAKEGLVTLIQYGFQNLGLNRLTAKVSPMNQPAIALIEKSPFRKEGCLRQWERWGHLWVDLNVYGLLKSEWMNVRNKR